MLQETERHHGKNAAQQQLVKDGKATVSIVRVLQADGSAQPKQVLVGINNRVNAQVIAGLKEGDQVVQNEQFGFIKFGSRVDIFLPLGTKVNLELNQVVKGGITVLGELS